MPASIAMRKLCLNKSGWVIGHPLSHAHRSRRARVAKVRHELTALSVKSLDSCVTYFHNILAKVKLPGRGPQTRTTHNGILKSMTNVPLLDLKSQFAQIRDEVMPVIDQVCASQHFILGEHVRALEQEISRYCSASHGIGVSSGTDALLLALMALEIGPGDGVITTPFTFFATAGTIARAGARPVFCDMDPVSFNLSPAAVGTFLAKHLERRGGELINKSMDGRVKDPVPVRTYRPSA